MLKTILASTLHKTVPFLLLGMLIMPNNLQAQEDWASLGRYRQANVQLGLPSAKEVRVVFMGDSIIDSWAAHFEKQFPGKAYIGRGISGQTTPQMLVRFQQDVIALKPAIVMITAGTNDIAGNTGPSTQAMIEDNLRSMVELAQANHIQIILGSVLPVHDYPWSPGLEPGPKIISLNQWIKHYAEEKGVGFVDFHSAMVDERLGLPKKYAKDGVHPTKSGYEFMAPMVQKAIDEILTKR